MLFPFNPDITSQLLASSGISTSGSAAGTGSSGTTASAAGTTGAAGTTPGPPGAGPAGPAGAGAGGVGVGVGVSSSSSSSSLTFFHCATYVALFLTRLSIPGFHPENVYHDACSLSRFHLNNGTSTL
jgi:hypothetical protein